MSGVLILFMRTYKNQFNLSLFLFFFEQLLILLLIFLSLKHEFDLVENLRIFVRTAKIKHQLK